MFFLLGGLTPHLKSAIASVRFEGPFRPLVGSNIESVVFDGKSDSLVYFYTLSCSTCKKLYSSLEAMANKLLAKPATAKLHFVKLETSQNDFPSPPFQLQGPPDYYLVRQGSRDHVIPYTGDNFNMEELKAFLESHISTTTSAKEDL